MCEEHRAFEVLLAKIPEELQKEVAALYENYVETGADRDYYRAIVRNEWPTSAEILAQYRQPKEQE